MPFFENVQWEDCHLTLMVNGRNNTLLHWWSIGARISSYVGGQWEEQFPFTLVVNTGREDILSLVINWEKNDLLH